MSKRRTTELWLLIAATPVLFLLFLMLLVNGEQEITIASFVVPGALVALFFIAHIAARKFAPGADPAILPIVYLLAGVGICFVLRLAPTDTALKQVVWLFAAVVCMIAVIIFIPSLEKLSRFKYTSLLFGLILLLLPLAPFIGAEYNGSKIWLSIAGFSFQPGEIAKICIVLFLAAYLADNREMLSTSRRGFLGLKIPNFRTLLPLLFMWVLALLIVIFEKDLGSALLFFGIFLVMIYICTGKLSYVIIGILLVAIGGVGLYYCFSHVQTRVQIWLDPFSDPSGSGYQLVQSLYSLADGGLFGTGIGRGLPTYIPEVMSDFIFSAIGEELGLFGACAVILLFMLFAVRGFATAARAKSDVAAFIAVGLTTSICLQAFIIIGGVTGFIPLTGLTLPFMSQGGSSLISSFIIVGLLLHAGNEGTGLGTELTGTMQFTKIGPRAAYTARAAQGSHSSAGAAAFRPQSDQGVLGRAALGKRLTILVTVFAILFAALIANLSYIQIVRADEIQNMETNNHTLKKQSERERGAILTSDNVILAESTKDEDGSYTRSYPQGSLASHVVGYYSQQYGASGIESSMSSSLVGDENFASLGDAIRSYAGIKTSGNDVVLTLNSKVQKAAESVLKGEKGACVVLDTKTGAVLAEASSPTYDINEVGSLLDGSTSSNDGELVNRATNSLYAPGSTFKTLTLAAALDTGTVKLKDKFKSSKTVEIGGGKITNYHKESHGKITVEEALQVSSNTVFAQIADKLGADKLVSYAEKFGFNTSYAQDFSLTKSIMPKASNMTQWEAAWAGVGQPVGSDSSTAGPQVSVMQMAMIMQAISNDGVLMKPYVVEKVLSSSGAVISSTKSQIAGQVVSSETAKTEQKALKKVVTSGTGTAAQISGAKVIGKTGTAETGKKLDDAWFIGTATKDGKSVTIAIVIEQGASGGGTAAPKAKTVLEEALNSIM